MTKIGLLSDTHGFLDKRIYEYFADCHEIWHAGDIGNIEIADLLSAFKPFRAVYGNIDNHDVRMSFPESARFMCEDVDVFMKHIGGHPGKYDRSVIQLISNNPPGLFISGHSHILKVMYDKKKRLLHINPGAAGKTGLHKVQSIVRFHIEKDKIKDLEIIELGEKTGSGPV
ncbi:MAG: metallophosphoesterase family protein [Bacteroidales bacterium]|nr:metallophosphoesterase family protein [Bacteroidales bacterium]